MSKIAPTMLVILDGFGVREETNSNAIKNAHAPTWDRLWKSGEFPTSHVEASGPAVGLPDGQMGNSEVGHMNLGAGRIIYQELTRIGKAIEDGDFFDNETLVKAAKSAAENDKALHLLGLLSPGGVHSHEDHILAMIELAHQQGCKKVYLHAFTDGRDTPPRSALPSIEKLQAKFDELGCGQIASLSGRYFGMDRDNRWDRIQAGWDLIVDGQANHTFSTPTEALDAAYARDENDEFVSPTAISDASGNAIQIEDGDSVVFMNFRADRARQLSRAFTDVDFDGFEKNRSVELATFVCLTQYAESIQAEVAYPPEPITHDLGHIMEQNGLKQLRAAETEKYAHVTFFFSGGRESLYQGEERVLVPSPDVATYDLQPEMSAPELTDKLVEAIHNQEHALIVCNYANGDMVGHTGVYDAAVKAVEALDSSLLRITQALQKVGGQCLITADHGNCEMMLNEATQQPHTAHTTEPVPLVYVGPKSLQLKEGGRLCDLAPTLLDLMGIAQPPQMTGQSLVT